MKRVYIDQNHWVALTRAPLGTPYDDAHLGVLALMREAADRGFASFPLSALHYIETQNRRDWRSRRDLADTMAELSRFHGIAPHNRLIDAELDHALGAMFGFAPQALIKPFGVGARFHTDVRSPGYEVPAEYARLIPDDVLWQFQQAANRQLEHYWLSGIPPEEEEKLRAQNPQFVPRASAQIGAEYAAEQERGRAERVRQGWNKGERAERFFTAAGIVDCVEPLNHILARERIDPEHIYALEREGMEQLIRDIPTLYASVEFQRHRHVASQKPIEPSDAGDQLAIPPALVYCDNVVTERQHAAGVRKLKLDDHLKTVVISQLSDLPQYLV